MKLMVRRESKISEHFKIKILERFLTVRWLCFQILRRRSNFDIKLKQRVFFIKPFSKLSIIPFYDNNCNSLFGQFSTKNNIKYFKELMRGFDNLMEKSSDTDISSPMFS